MSLDIENGNIRWEEFGNVLKFYKLYLIVLVNGVVNFILLVKLCKDWSVENRIIFLFYCCIIYVVMKIIESLFIGYLLKIN